MTTPPTPTIGRIVHVLADPLLNNGATVAPAVITRVFGPALVNVRVLYDGNSHPEWRCSVGLYPDQDTATARQPGRGAFWPPRA